MLKCNIHAAIAPGSDVLGLGICLRNEKGEFLFAKIIHFKGFILVKEAEALCLFHAIKWVRSLNLSNVIFDMNAKSVVYVVKSHSRALTEFGEIIEKCQTVTTVGAKCYVFFVKRQKNEVVHTLARETRFSSSSYGF